MSDYYTTIKTEETQGYNIVCSVAPEHMSIEDVFCESCHDVAETRKKIEDGTLEWFIARVQAFKCGVLLGESYIGGLLYDRYEAFIPDYYLDMVHDAIEDARNTLTKLMQPV